MSHLIQASLNSASVNVLHQARRRVHRQCLLALACALFPSLVLAAEPTRFEDAAIRAIQFVDEHEGWAVGDEGVIWHTIDGGQTWERQPSATRASLQGVCFLDPFTGFVVGRESLPLGAGSTGIVLFTRDGGTRWQPASVREFPGLRQVKFFDRKHGILVGEASDAHPSGAFTTDDGGATWKPLPGPRTPGWTTADFANARTGLFGGPWGSLATLHGSALLPADVDGLTPRTIRAVQLHGEDAWAVGDGGLLLKSTGTAGKKWTAVDLDLPAELRRAWDFHALHFVHYSGWIVGRPGSTILHTWDRGQSWQTQGTGQSLPLHAVHFVNEQRGWAGGELGTILHTSDGGKTWKVQRRGGHRVAVLAINAEMHHVPLAALASLGAEDGYLAAAVAVTAHDPTQGRAVRAFDSDRLAEAARLAGGCGAEALWQFPVPSHLAAGTPRQLAQHWGGSMDEARGQEELVRQLVLAMRIWRPDVVLTDNPDAESPSGTVGAMTALAAAKAFDLAGKADAFPEQIAKLDLQPWAPSKLYGRWDVGKEANVVVDLDSPRRELGRSPNDHAATARGVLQDAFEEPASAMPLKLLASRLEGAEAHKSLMQGIQLSPGGQARRHLSPREDVAGWDQIVKTAQQRRDLKGIAKHNLADAGIGRQLPSMLPKALKDLPDDQAGEAAYALGRAYAQAGQWLMAREVFMFMLDKYPSHPLAPDACRWLIRFGGSSEARRRDELQNFKIHGHVWFEPTPKDGASRAFLRVDPSQTGPLTFRAARRGQEFAEDLRNWYKSALALEDVLAGFGSLQGDDPGVQFCLQAAKRGLGKFDETDLWYSQFKLRQPSGPWHDAAAAELWLGKRAGQPPKPIFQCAPIEEPPFLDGKLDDDCWSKNKPIVLKDASGLTAGNYPTEVWLAHDAGHLYLALRCKHPEGGDHYVAPLKPRSRDADLRPFDRVSLLLDLDRDYATCYHLQVDQRGCTFEDCWGDKTWDPTWYVAVHSDATSWQIEAAIPLSELTGNPIGTGQTWAANVVRTIPGKGVQAFSLPADAEPRPEGMGLLHFPPLSRAAPKD